MTDEEINYELRKDSGCFNTNNAVTLFFYLLMRDYMPCGKVDMIISEIQKTRDFSHHKLTNGFLGRYASNLTKRLFQKKNNDENETINNEE